MPILSLLIALVIAATLSFMSLSSYQNWREQKALDQGVDLMRNQIELARTLNITRGESIYLCASTDGIECNASWQGPITIFTSNTPPKIEKILSLATLPPSIKIEKEKGFNNSRTLRFMNTGELVYNGSFEIKSTHQARCFTLNKTGDLKEVACLNQAEDG